NIPDALIDFSIDEIAIRNQSGIGVGVLAAILQNGTNYLNYSGVGVVNSDFLWQTFSFKNLRATDFGNYIPGTGTLGPDHPDFSASGNAIQIGFWTGNNNSGFTDSRAAGFDNWTVVVHQAPRLTHVTLL